MEVVVLVKFVFKLLFWTFFLQFNALDKFLCKLSLQTTFLKQSPQTGGPIKLSQKLVMNTSVTDGHTYMDGRTCERNAVLCCGRIRNTSDNDDVNTTTMINRSIFDRMGGDETSDIGFRPRPRGRGSIIIITTIVIVLIIVIKMGWSFFLLSTSSPHLPYIDEKH